MTFSTKQAPAPAQAADSSAYGVAGHPRAPISARIDSRQIFGNRREIEIEHEGSLYRLRVTHSGKLILTK